MNPEDIQKKYFNPGTKGYKILSYYYTHYRDLFVKTIHSEFDEFMHQIYLNVSGIRFSDEIKNAEAYIIGTIKIQCRVQLDLALKMKKMRQIEINDKSDDNEVSVLENLPNKELDPHSKVESSEVFILINVFKLSLSKPERMLFNSLIDDIPRKKIAKKWDQNLNTVDTQIRRLRIKLLTFLKDKGYSFEMFSKYDVKKN